MLLRRRAFRVAALACIASLCAITLLSHVHNSAEHRSAHLSRRYPSGSNRALPCRSLPHTDDVLLVMRTGATEFAERFPIHLEATLRCAPNYLIFSDHEESFRGVDVQDALQHVSESIKQRHPDFELYRRLRVSKRGRKALKNEELSTFSTSSRNSKSASRSGKLSNAGWKLDKWKFLPMMNLTLGRATEDIKWFVFIETDTYLVWTNVLNYLFESKSLDWRRKQYVGLRYLSETLGFAHGGSGFAITRPALEDVVAEFLENQAKWEAFTANGWAGDIVLATAFKEIGINLTEAEPYTWQNVNIGGVKWDEGDRDSWCSPPVTFHHMSPREIERLWEFEVDALAGANVDGRIRGSQRTGRPIHHGDLYKHYVLPQVEASPVRLHWSNQANSDHGPVDSIEACGDICKGFESCLQYMLSSDGRCQLSRSPSLGEPSRGETAGWMIDRLRAFGKERQAWCSQDTEEV